MDLPYFVKVITYFTLFYPIVMSIIWIIGSVLHNIKFKKVEEESIKELDEQRFIILTPIFNEEQDIYISI